MFCRFVILAGPAKYINDHIMPCCGLVCIICIYMSHVTCIYIHLFFRGKPSATWDLWIRSLLGLRLASWSRPLHLWPFRGTVAVEKVLKWTAPRVNVGRLAINKLLKHRMLSCRSFVRVWLNWINSPCCNKRSRFNHRKHFQQVLGVWLGAWKAARSQCTSDIKDRYEYIIDKISYHLRGNLFCSGFEARCLRPSPWLPSIACFSSF